MWVFSFLVLLASEVQGAMVSIEAGGSIILESGSGGGSAADSAAAVAQLSTQMASMIEQMSAMAQRLNDLESQLAIVKSSVAFPPSVPPPFSPPSPPLFPSPSAPPLISGTWGGTALVKADTSTSLTIHGGSPWGPSYTDALSTDMGVPLNSCATYTDINTSDANIVVLYDPSTVFLIRNDAWNSVDLNGWSSVSAGNYISGEGSISLYRRAFAAGSHTIDNNSAMYLFCSPSA